MHQIPILTIRLLDFNVDKNHFTKTKIFNELKTLVKKNIVLFNSKEINIDIFHNKINKYSGIQLDTSKGIIEWTAIGKHEVQALEMWYMLFQEKHKNSLKNVEEIREFYTPILLNHYKNYRIESLLINKKLTDTLNITKNEFEKQKEVEPYIESNIITFISNYNLDSMENKSIKVNVLELCYLKKAPKIYHDNKKTGLDIYFMCNFLLPQTVRLGQSTALGFGKVTHI